MSNLEMRTKTYEFDGVNIQLRTLKDTQQFEDVDNAAEKLGINSTVWPLFGVLWPAGEILAKLMVTKKIEGLRILEMGCGVGLPSLVLNSRDADISSSDQHPLSETFLSENTKLNKSADIPFYVSDWANFDKELGKFDLIIGSDLLYQPDHAALLANFVKNYANDKAEVMLVDPRRGNISKFKKEMTLLDFTHEVTYFEGFKGQVITFNRQ
jgi:predicted nicotinamide N-methyase